MIYTIEDLAKGRVILKNTGDDTPENLEKIKNILKEAFPEDDSAVLGTSNYYYLWSGSDHLWNCASNVDGLELPIQNLELFSVKNQRFPFTITTQDVALLITVFENTPWCDAIMRNVGIEIIKTGYSTVYKEGYETLRKAAISSEQQEALDSIFGKEPTIEWTPNDIYKVKLNETGLNGYRMAAEDYLEFYIHGDSGEIFTLKETDVIEKASASDLIKQLA